MEDPRRDVSRSILSSGAITALAYGIPILGIVTVLPQSKIHAHRVRWCNPARSAPRRHEGRRAMSASVRRELRLPLGVGREPDAVRGVHAGNARDGDRVRAGLLRARRRRAQARGRRVPGPGPRARSKRASDGRAGLPAGAQDELELVDEEVGALARDAERRLHLQHVQVVAGGLDDDAPLAHALADRLTHRGRRLARLPAADELDAPVEPDAVHGADQIMPAGQLAQAGEQVLADDARVLLQTLRLDRVDDGEAGPAADRVAAGRGEEAALRGERLGDLAAGDDGAHRMPVAERLGDGDDVGRDALFDEAPEVVAEPAVADLDLVRDADSA